MTGWLVNIVPVPYPELPDAPESYEEAWRKYVDPALTVTSGADREDWLEQAARLEAAMRLLDDPLLRVYGRGIVDRDGRPAGADAIKGRAYYGEVLNADVRRPADYPLETGNAHRYANSPVVRGLMRRETLLTPVNAGKVEQAVRAIASHGHGVVVKYVLREKVLPTVRLTPEEAPRFDAGRWFGWEDVRFEDEPDGVLVQERVDMRREYRVFVVGRRPVCGAGCIESCTPMDNEATFDPKMEERRNDGVVVRDPGAADAYRRFAAQVAGLIADEGYIRGPYVMDLATVDGRPCVIELNRMNNAGLYALDMDALLKTINRHPGRFMPERPGLPAASSRRPIGRPSEGDL